jgi:hypothetical protein
MIINEIVTGNFIIACFNFETRTFYEGATPEELEQSARALVPFEVALWRIRLVLKLMGLENTIEASLEQLEEPTRTAAKYVWQFGSFIERESQTVLLVQSVTQMANEQLDQMFIQANEIVV